MRRIALTGLVAGTALLAASSAQAAVGWHTRQTAESNILNAPRALARWNRSFVNPETRLVRRNVTVTCSGRGTHHGNRFARFACTVRYRATEVRMIYTAQASNGFELHGR